MNNTTTTQQVLDNVRISSQARGFLSTLPRPAQEAILHELALIAGGHSLEFADVHNPAIVEFCRKNGLSDPKRFKVMSVRHEVGGVRIIFAFDESKSPRLMYILRASERPNAYLDNR